MNKIKIKEDILEKENAKRDITIIHLADIHFNLNTSQEKLKKITNEIIKNNPDYIVITGDIIDTPKIINNNYKIKELLEFLTNLASYAKVLISLGNHDIFVSSDRMFFKKLNEFKNIYILDNDKYLDDYVYISGITLPNNYYYNITGKESSSALLDHLDKFDKLINDLPKNIPKIMLIHSPICLCNSDVLNKIKDYDLLLSGHTHNGMVFPLIDNIYPKNKGIIAPNKKILPDIARGRIDKYVKNNKISIIINGGVTKLSYSSKISKLNFLYNIDINKIIITKKRGKYYE